MDNLNDTLADLETQMATNEQQMRDLLTSLSLTQLFDETNVMRTECNQKISEYNRMTEDELVFFPEVDIDYSTNQLLDQFIEMYKYNFSLVAIIDEKQETQRALERYNQVVLGSGNAENSINRPSVSTSTSRTLTAFQSQKKELGVQYVECYKTIEYAKAAQELEQEELDALNRYNDLGI